MSAPGFDHLRTGEGPPLVLLHPALTTWRMWQPVIGALRERHDVFAPTLPGHHGGPQPPAELTFAGLADAVERQLDTAGIGQAHLVGNSLGAVMALELAARGRGLSATAISPPGAWNTARDRLLLELMLGTAVHVARAPVPAVPLLHRAPHLRKLALAPLMRHGERVPPLEVALLLAGRRSSARFVAALIAGLRREGHREPPFGATSVPTTIAWPEHDRVLPYHRFGAPLHSLLPDASHVRLPGTGHVPMYDDPALVAQTILSLSSPSSPSIGTAV